MMTFKGRVVYDRKKNIMKPAALARIIRSYSDGIGGSEFGRFVVNILELTLAKIPVADDWKINFWRYLLNSFNRAALEEIFVPERFRSQSSVDSSSQVPGVVREIPDGSESAVDRKRRILEEGK